MFKKKKQIELTEEQKEEIRIKDFFDRILPSTIKFSTDHYIIGDSYRCVWAIKEYPPTTEELALFSQLADRNNLTVRLYSRLVDALEQRKIIQNATRRNKLSTGSNDAVENITAEGNLQDVVTLIAELRKNKEPLLHCAVYLELKAESMQKLRELQSDIIMELTRSKMSVDRLTLRQKEGFLSVLPCGANMFKEQFERVLPASSVANLYPFNYSGKTDPKGFFIGRDKYGTNILVDFDRRADDKTNANCLILGNSGQGKSFLMKLILTNLRESGKRIISLDPEAEYEELTKALGGCYIDFMSGEYIINPLEPKSFGAGNDDNDNNTDERELGAGSACPEAFRRVTRLSQHIAYLKDFFRAYKEFNDEQLDTLEIILTKLYKNFGITDYTDYDKLSKMDYPNLEYACASGMSYITSDTKGDLYRNYGAIAKKYYGYNVSVIDLRNPTKSDGFNLLHLVNKYMDLWKENTDNLSYKAKAEKYAKITSKTIISSGGDNASYGQNAYFYDAAEGLLTSAILLVSEFCPKEKRHIVTVFKIIQELMSKEDGKKENGFTKIMELLPNEHKAKWFAGAALNTSDQSMASVVSTALSRLNTFLDSEMEAILCFNTSIDAEKFCNEKSAIFLVMPEEDSSKYFMISLIVQQLYREMLLVADEKGGKLDNRVMMYLDEMGTIPKIESAEMMFSASRSRRISIIAIIQSFAQLNQNYGEHGAEIITDNTQLTIFGGFAPNSKSAEILSKAMGSRTVMSGSISRSKNDPSQSLQMIERPLMTPDELKSMPKGQFIVMKTGTNPMISKLKLFFKWGIEFGEKYEIEDKGNRLVKYSDKNELLKSILKKYPRVKKKSDDTDYNESPQVHSIPPRNKRAPRNDINK